MGVFAPSEREVCERNRDGDVFKNVKCVRETEILVEQQPPQGVFVCEHAGCVINNFTGNQKGLCIHIHMHIRILTKYNIKQLGPSSTSL